MNSKVFSRVLMTAGVVAGVVSLPSIASADTSANIGVGGNVPSTLAITAAADGGATSTSVTTGTETIAKIADLSMETNNSTGLTLTVNAGTVTNGDSETMPFEVLILEDGASTPATTAFSAGTQTYNSGGANASGASIGLRDLYIKYKPAALQDPGTYSGTVTVTVADNG